MTITVSIGEFRQNLSDYLTKVEEGHQVTLKDGKRGKIIATLVPEKQFDPEAYKAMLDRVAGTFTAKNHPEWATKKKAERWLRKSRLADERTFDVHA